MDKDEMSKLDFLKYKKTAQEFLDDTGLELKDALTLVESEIQKFKK